jgi:hypothetical protein
MIYTDNWIKNDFEKTNIIIEINNVIKLKNPLGESFWVVVKEILPGDKFIGTVNNHLINKSKYNYNDMVSFSRNEIRDYKNRKIQDKQAQFVNEIIKIFIEEVGRMPTEKEFDRLFTKISPTK